MCGGARVVVYRDMQSTAGDRPGVELQRAPWIPGAQCSAAFLLPGTSFTRPTFSCALPAVFSALPLRSSLRFLVALPAISLWDLCHRGRPESLV